MRSPINRLCTDAISDLLFTTDELASQNLREEGAAAERIQFVGNTMIDTLLRHVERARGLPLVYGVSKGEYAVVTLHRPANVDSVERLVPLVNVINELAERIPILFPVHPRTAPRLAEVWLLKQ